MTALLDSGVWQGQIYSGGWVGAHGGDMPIVEPGTGGQLGRAGRSDASDVAAAATAAAGTGARFAGTANLDAFTDQRWITIRGDIPAYPF